ncbi:PIN domain-containing protein [Halococcus salsus]|uniref:PIN domain-containing protein n=1 Tax=Halococcus salsus TaxID=2162894 RepID=UPI00135A636A|nr:PIN domain-containing protein [Halococcus salsus]
MSRRLGTVVFDTEPMIAYFFNEDGSDEVEKELQSVRDGATGVMSVVNLTEVFYLVANMRSVSKAKKCVQSIREFGIEIVECMPTWETAAMIKHTYSIALGDSYAVAAADERNGTLIVGADDDFDEVTEVPISRFRTEAA